MSRGHIDYIAEYTIPRKHYSGYVDAHPDLYPKNVPANSWIGSLLNQPSEGERANTELIELTSDELKLAPKYPHQELASKVFLRLNGPFKGDDELLAVYGYDNRHIINLDYKVGSNIYEPVIPRPNTRRLMKEEGCWSRAKKEDNPKRVRKITRLPDYIYLQ